MFNRLLLPLMLLTSSAFAADSVLRITKDNFEATLAQTDKPIIIDVFATWCGPCKQLKPIFHAFAHANANLYLCADVDGDQSRELMTKMGVQAFPTVLVYRKKVLIGKIIGMRSADKFKAAIEKIVTNTGKIPLVAS